MGSEQAVILAEGGDAGGLGPITVGVPEQKLELVPPPDKAATSQYLRFGGLVEILRYNSVAGRDSPRAWITFSRAKGYLKHTFSASQGVIGGAVVPFSVLCEDRVLKAKKEAASQGVIGGAVVPFSALCEDRVLKTKKEEVINFLMSFGLTRTDAEDVLSALGT
jgi:hypothetical protein